MNTSEFAGYEKMPNSLKKLNLSDKDFLELDKLKWVATEKVHGANFSFIYHNKRLKFAKRKEYLSWNDDFFGFQVVVNKLENKVIQLFEELSANVQAEKIIIYGELFGGEYPHPEVEQDKHVQAIQTGVYYTPSVEFCAFDIAVEPKGPESKYYLDYEMSVSYFDRFGLFYAKPLYVGKLGDILNFNTRINTLIPQDFNLPELPNNLIEGVVVKPFSNFNTCKLKFRPIVKIKNKEFEEEQKFHEATKWSYVPDISSNNEDLSFLIEALRSYVTENRLNNAVSKVGFLDFKNSARMEEIKAEYLGDVFTDFNENNSGLLNELNQEQKKWLEERIKAEINGMVNSLSLKEGKI